MKYKEDTRYFDNKMKATQKCPCGHSVDIPVFKEKELCTWCGNYVYRTKEIEFKAKLAKELKLCKNQNQ